MPFGYFHKLIIGTLFLLSGNLCLSQPASRHYVDSAFSTFIKDFGLKRAVMYVVNGLPYDSLQIDTALRKFDLANLIEFKFMTCQQALIHCNNDIAIILFAYPQKDKVKRKAWKNSKRLFSNNPQKPILVVNNKLVDSTKSEDKFRSFRLKDIMYIDTISIDKIPQVKIWTEKKECF